MTENIKNWTKDRLKTDWIEAGMKCVYRHGFKWKGAKARVISKEEALELLPSYDIGTSYREIDFCNEDGETVLEFNELSEYDML